MFMRLSRWQPFQTQGSLWDQLHQFQSEMNRLFDRWGSTGARALGLGGYPAINAYEDKDTIHVQAELPGMQLNDLEIYVTGGNQLTIKGQRKPPQLDKGIWHRQERGFGNFVRTLTLPYVVDADKVEARFENGVLRVNLERHESSKPRKIQIRGE
jgi:HSP20 family protein